MPWKRWKMKVVDEVEGEGSRSTALEYDALVPEANRLRNNEAPEVGQVRWVKVEIFVQVLSKLTFEGQPCSTLYRL